MVRFVVVVVVYVYCHRQLIIADARALSTTIMSADLKLACLVFDNNPSLEHVISFKISKDDDVRTLKRRIRDIITDDPDFHRFLNSTLEMWSVSIPKPASNALLKDSINRLNLDTRTSLFGSMQLSDAFPSHIAGHIHIAARAIPLVLELNCWVKGDELGHVFPVKIARIESVGELRNKIKEEKRPQFDDIPADHLVLYTVSVCLNDLATQSPEPDLTAMTRLSQSDKLTKVFPEVPDREYQYIIVQRPESKHKWTLILSTDILLKVRLSRNLLL
jgi:hypothetical protein